MKNKRVKKHRVKKYSVMIIPDNKAKVWRWEVSRRKIEAAIATCLTLAFITTGSIWGFAHYRSGYLATEDIRLQNAKFEEERSELISKFSNLEQTVERTERFASRLEATVGIETEQIQKGIGPIAEDDIAKPTTVAKFDNLKFNKDIDKLSFKNIDGSIENLDSTVSSIEDRLHAVYELQKDRMTYWASIPSIWPAKGWMTSDFGPRRRPLRGGSSFHKGIDIAAPPGTPILAPGDGVVTFSGYKRGMGKTIMVDHGYGVVSVYGHNSSNYVKEGDRVRRGEIIGGVGRTGLATGSHLHYQVEVDGVAVDPMKYIQKM